MKWPLVIFIAAVTTACSKPAPPHPNVVVVLVDTLRADRLGAHGSQRKITPKLDALADQSVVFSRAIAPANWTKPSVASLFTGLYPGHHGAVESAAQDHNHSALAPQLTTLAEVLGDAGFDTAAFITNPHINAADQFDQGFEHFVQPAGPAVALVNKAGSWLDDRTKDRPFFLYLHLIDPHSPYDPPPDVRAALEPPFDATGAPFTEAGNPMEVVAWLRQYKEHQGKWRRRPFAFDTSTLRPELLDQTLLSSVQRRHPEITRDNLLEHTSFSFTDFDDPELLRRVNHLQALYDAEIAWVDRAVGRFLEGLRQRSLDNNTLIVFVSDHGESFLENGFWGHNNELSREELEIPLWVRLPPGDAARTSGRCPTAVSLVDVLPTIIDLLQLPPVQGLDGLSLRPLIETLDDAATEWAAPERMVFSESLKSDREQVAAWGNQTFWVRSESDEGKVSWRTDPLTQAPSKKQKAAMTTAVQALRNSRAAQLKDTTHDGEPSPALTSEQISALKELGYQGPADKH